MFPTVAPNDVIHMREPLSHDTVQKALNAAMGGVKIEGTFSTHCFRRGGAQYWFMSALLGQRWPLCCVQWWGAWAEGEQVSAVC